MHDGITFEQLGKPALVICTVPFEETGRAIARTVGLSDYVFALVAHPIGSIQPATLSERAEDAYRQGLSILLGEGGSK